VAAVDRLLERLNSLDEVTDYATSNSHTPQSVKDHALRAVGIQGLSAFERFVRDRGSEWASHLTSARIPATHLRGTVAYSDRIVQTLPRRFRDLEDVDRSRLVEELASTLTSFSAGSLVGHDLFFAWSGSNVQTTDIEDMVKLVGITRGWRELTSAWKVLDPRFPGNASAESTMKTFASVRHTLAHNVDAVVDPIIVSAVTRNVRLTALLFDVCVSEALKAICLGQPVPTNLGSVLKRRTIVKDGKSWPEYPPGAGRAFRRHGSLSVALAETGLRARQRGEVVVALDANEIVDWRASI
jgi:hypothetical protein